MSTTERAHQIALAAIQLDTQNQADFLKSACEGDLELLRLVLKELSRLTQNTLTSDCDSESDSRPSQADFEYESLVPTDFDVQSATAAPQPSIGPGTLIAGKYRLLQLIGEGGMGAVWLAEQTEPVRRSVAVKLIKPGNDTQQVVARFEAERQALAVMDHPNIAKILDGGSLSDQGSPFFVMELVKGMPITKFCDTQRMSLADRLQLFISVCEAIQHAHQKGVIHRDIKPSNILVAVVDGKPVPKVIDFGVAKATGLSLTDKTLFTLAGAVVGTPQYMSPEQADPDCKDVDTRTDVYSLGVVLYEMLTGTPPFDAKRLGRAALLEILRVIREVDPPSPSARLSTDKGIGTISASRRTEPSRLTRMVRGELDWIVMKALEKERVRRYDSASGLAQDLRSFLSGERVLAAPPSRLYRLKKVLRRNRIAVAAASLVFLSLVSGIIATAIGLSHARYERNQANQARKDEQIQRMQAEAASRQAFAALQAFTDDFVERQFGSRAVLTANDRAILQKALQQWEAFASIQGESQESQRIRAEGQFRVAKLRQYLGVPGADQGYRQAVELLQDAIGKSPQQVELYHQLADARIGLGKLVLGSGAVDEALGQMDDALQSIGKALEHNPGAVNLLLVKGNALSARGVVLRAANRLQQAAEAYQSALETLQAVTREAPDNVEAFAALAVTHNNMANLLIALNQFDEARTHYEAGREVRRTLIDRFPDDPQRLSDLGDSDYGLGDLAVRMGETQQALKFYQAAAGTYGQLLKLAPRVPEYRDASAKIQRNIGVMWSRLGNPETAMEAWRQGLAIRAQLVDDFPEIDVFLRSYAVDRIQLGQEYSKSGELDAATDEFSSAISDLQELSAEHPENRDFKTYLAQAFCDLALVEERRQRPTEADEKMRQSLDIMASLNQYDGDVLRNLSYVHWNYAKILMNRKQIDSASEQFELAGQALDRAAEIEPENPRHWETIRGLQSEIAVSYETTGRIDLAIQHYLAALDAAQTVQELVPDGLAHRIEVAGLRNRLALAYAEAKQTDAATKEFQLSNAVLEGILKDSPGHPHALVLQAGNKVNGAELLGADEAPQQKLSLLSEAIDELEAVHAANPDNRVALNYLQTALMKRAELLEQLGEFGRAAGDWLSAAELPFSSDEITFRSKGAQSLVRDGQTEQALAVVESIKDVAAPPTIFARARIYAMAYGNSADESHAEQSAAEIEKLIKMGLDDVQRLRNDPDLKSMQEFPAFRALIKQLEDGGKQNRVLTICPLAVHWTPTPCG